MSDIYFKPLELKYQSKVDVNKLLKFIRELKDGAEFPPIQVRHLPTGEYRVLNGSHRALAHGFCNRVVAGYVEGDGE